MSKGKQGTRKKLLKALLNGNRPLLLTSLPLSPGLRAVILAPHPDDFDAIGVSLQHLFTHRVEIDLAVLTSGASGVEDGFTQIFAPGTSLSQRDKAAVREEEQRASCRFFGLPEERLSFLHLQEDGQGHPYEHPANLEVVTDYLLSNRPDLVFLPHGNDTNPGHQRTYSMLHKIAREENLDLIACLNRDPKTITMRSDLYMPFGLKRAAWKSNLLRLHRSQDERNLHTRQIGFDERILQMNRQAALLLGLATKTGREAMYAEDFEVEMIAPENSGESAG